MIFLDNLITIEETEITSTSNDFRYPVLNLKDHRITKTYRSNNDMQADVLIDFKTIYEINIIMLTADKWGVNSPIIVEFNNTEDFSNPAKSYSIDIDANYNFAFLELENSIYYRYARLRLTGIPYIELSKIFIGNKINFNRRVSYNWRYSNKDLTKVRYNLIGQPFFDELPNRIEIDFNLSLLTIEEKELLEYNLYDTKKNKPIWLLLDKDKCMSSDPKRIAGMFFLKDIPSFTFVTGNFYNTSFSFIEAK